MSFSIPQRLPDFNDQDRRQYENWSHVSRNSHTRQNSAFTYKDKPFYGGVHPARRKHWYTSKWFLGSLGILVLFYLMHQLVPGTQQEFEEELLKTHEGQEANDWETRRERVKEAFRYSWKGYVDHAWGKDEYRPISGTGKNMIPEGSWPTVSLLTAGMGWVIVDALDTMLLMNLTDEITRARGWIIKSLNWDQDKEVSLFETTIRMLGGLLSAHYLSGNDDVYLEKAVDLADRLLGGFESPTGIPYASVNLKQRTGVQSWNDGGSSTTAEVSTLQLEFKYLAQLTGETLYWEKTEKVMEALESNKATDGLVPIFVSPETGLYTTKEIRLGSRGDSYYEYLLKQYLQTSKRENIYRTMYDHAMSGVKRHLVGYSYPSHFTFVGELPQGVGSNLSPKMDHLVCFLGGNLALGATEGKTLAEARKKGWTVKQQADLDLAEELARSCFEMYNITQTGIAPEIVRFNTDMSKNEDITIKPNDRHNIQRPETVESLFILWRITGDVKYREWGWKIFQAFEKWGKVGNGGGYTSLDDVTQIPPPKRDSMESFWLAETLKYLYLLFGPDDILPLDKVVFNTEAHPFPIFAMDTHFKTGWAIKEQQ